MAGEAKYPSRNFCLALYCLGHSRSLSLHAGVLPSLECGDRQDFCSCQPGVSVDTLTPWSSGLGQHSAGQGLAPKSGHLSPLRPAPPLPSSTLQFPPLPSPPLLSFPFPPLPSPSHPIPTHPISSHPFPFHPLPSPPISPRVSTSLRPVQSCCGSTSGSLGLRNTHPHIYALVWLNLKFTFEVIFFNPLKTSLCCFWFSAFCWAIW